MRDRMGYLKLTHWRDSPAVQSLQGFVSPPSTPTTICAGYTEKKVAFEQNSASENN